MDRVIEDKELGRLVVRDNVRAKRLVFRTKADAIYISIPMLLLIINTNKRIILHKKER